MVNAEQLQQSKVVQPHQCPALGGRGARPGSTHTQTHWSLCAAAACVPVTATRSILPVHCVLPPSPTLDESATRGRVCRCRRHSRSVGQLLPRRSPQQSPCSALPIARCNTGTRGRILWVETSSSRRRASCSCRQCALTASRSSTRTRRSLPAQL